MTTKANKMKTLTAGVGVLALLTMTACGNDDNDNGTDNGSDDSSTEEEEEDELDGLFEENEVIQEVGMKSEAFVSELHNVDVDTLEDEGAVSDPEDDEEVITYLESHLSYLLDEYIDYDYDADIEDRRELIEGVLIQVFFAQLTPENSIIVDHDYIDIHDDNETVDVFLLPAVDELPEGQDVREVWDEIVEQDQPLVWNNVDGEWLIDGDSLIIDEDELFGGPVESDLNDDVDETFEAEVEEVEDNNS